MRKGNNIRQRKDGRFEARYEKARDANGKIIYGYCYGSTYAEAESKRARITQEKSVLKQMNLLILGAGDHGTEVKELAQSLRVFNKISFLDDNKLPDENILGSCKNLSNYVDDYPIAVPAIGDSSVRCRWMNELSQAGFVIPTFIHPTATVAANAQIEIGTVICAGATIGRNANIGRGCIIDSGAVVERNAVVPDWTLVNCGEKYLCNSEDSK